MAPKTVRRPVVKGCAGNKHETTVNFKLACNLLVACGLYICFCLMYKKECFIGKITMINQQNDTAMLALCSKLHQYYYNGNYAGIMCQLQL